MAAGPFSLGGQLVSRPPMLVTSTPDVTVPPMARGFRIMHRDRAIWIKEDDDPKTVVPDILDTWGVQLATKVVKEIARLNHLEVSSYAFDIAQKMERSDSNAIKRYMSHPVQDVFDKKEIEQHGLGFLTAVQRQLKLSLQRYVQSLQSHPQGMPAPSITAGPPVPSFGSGAPPKSGDWLPYVEANRNRLQSSGTGGRSPAYTAATRISVTGNTTSGGNGRYSALRISHANTIDTARRGDSLPSPAFRPAPYATAKSRWVSDGYDGYQDNKTSNLSNSQTVRNLSSPQPADATTSSGQHVMGPPGQASGGNMYQEYAPAQYPLRYYHHNGIPYPPMYYQATASPSYYVPGPFQQAPPSEYQPQSLGYASKLSAPQEGHENVSFQEHNNSHGKLRQGSVNKLPVRRNSLRNSGVRTYRNQAPDDQLYRPSNGTYGPGLNESKDHHTTNARRSSATWPGDGSEPKSIPPGRTSIQQMFPAEPFPNLNDGVQHSSQEHHNAAQLGDKIPPSRKITDSFIGYEVNTIDTVYVGRIPGDLDVSVILDLLKPYCCQISVGQSGSSDSVKGTKKWALFNVGSTQDVRNCLRHDGYQIQAGEHIKVRVPIRYHTGNYEGQSSREAHRHSNASLQHETTLGSAFSNDARNPNYQRYHKSRSNSMARESFTSHEGAVQKSGNFALTSKVDERDEHAFISLDNADEALNEESSAPRKQLEIEQSSRATSQSRTPKKRGKKGGVKSVSGTPAGEESLPTSSSPVLDGSPKKPDRRFKKKKPVEYPVSSEHTEVPPTANDKISVFHQAAVSSSNENQREIAAPSGETDPTTKHLGSEKGSKDVTLEHERTHSIDSDIQKVPTAAAEGLIHLEPPPDCLEQKANSTVAKDASKPSESLQSSVTPTSKIPVCSPGLAHPQLSDKSSSPQPTNPGTTETADVGAEQHVADSSKQNSLTRSPGQVLSSMQLELPNLQTNCMTTVSVGEKDLSASNKDLGTLPSSQRLSADNMAPTAVLDSAQTHLGKRSVTAPVDSWINPFRRQQLLEKQQKQAAKNQKKKEKKKGTQLKTSSSLKPAPEFDSRSASVLGKHEAENEITSLAEQRSLPSVTHSSMPASNIKGKKSILAQDNGNEMQKSSDHGVFAAPKRPLNSDSIFKSESSTVLWKNPSKADFLTQQASDQSGRNSENFIAFRGSSVASTETLKEEDFSRHLNLDDIATPPMRTRSNTATASELSVVVGQKTVPPNTPAQAIKKEELSMPRVADAAHLERSLSTLSLSDSLNSGLTEAIRTKGVAPMEEGAGAKLTQTDTKSKDSKKDCSSLPKTVSSMLTSNQSPNLLDQNDSMELIGGIHSAGSLEVVETVATTSTDQGANGREAGDDEKNQEAKRKRKSKKKSNKKKRNSQANDDAADEAVQEPKEKSEWIWRNPDGTLPGPSSGAANLLARTNSALPAPTFGVGEVTDLYGASSNRKLVTNLTSTTYKIIPDGTMTPLFATTNQVESRPGTSAGQANAEAIMGAKKNDSIFIDLARKDTLGAAANKDHYPSSIEMTRKDSAMANGTQNTALPSLKLLGDVALQKLSMNGKAENEPFEDHNSVMHRHLHAMAHSVGKKGGQGGPVGPTKSQKKTAESSDESEVDLFEKVIIAGDLDREKGEDYKYEADRQRRREQRRRDRT